MAEKEYIERSEALDIVKRTSGDYATAFSEIRKLPAIELVRCKDCVHYDCIENHCDLFDFDVPNDLFFCRDGFKSD